MPPPGSSAERGRRHRRPPRTCWPSWPAIAARRGRAATRTIAALRRQLPAYTDAICGFIDSARLADQAGLAALPAGRVHPEPANDLTDGADRRPLKDALATSSARPPRRRRSSRTRRLPLRRVSLVVAGARRWSSVPASVLLCIVAGSITRPVGRVGRPLEATGDGRPDPVTRRRASATRSAGWPRAGRGAGTACARCCPTVGSSADAVAASLGGAVGVLGADLGVGGGDRGPVGCGVGCRGGGLAQRADGGGRRRADGCVASGRSRRTPRRPARSRTRAVERRRDDDGDGGEAG